MAELKKGYKHNPNAEWVGEVPDSWEFYKGKYVFGERFEKGNEKNLELLSPTQKYGVIPQSMYDELSGMRAVKVKESTDLSLFKTVHVGDFCISLRSFQGGFEYSKYEGVVSPAYHILFPKKIIEDGYYKYLFKEQSFIAEMNSYCQSLRDGKNISYTDFGKTLIPYPPLAEQRAIASYLDDRCSKLDEIIAEAEKSIEEYKELKQAVIFEAVTKGLDKNAPMRESGIEWIREIPSTWNVIRIKYLLDEINNRSETGEEEPLSVSQVLGVVPSTMIAVANPASSTIGQKIVEPGDLVFNKLKAHLGVFFVSDYKGLVSPDYAVYRANDKVNPKYLEYLFHTPACITEFKKYITGVAVGLMRLYTSDLFNISIALPKRSEQERIIEYLAVNVSKYDALISEKQSLIEDLKAYKKSLIYEVVTGKRRIS